MHERITATKTHSDDADFLYLSANTLTSLNLSTRNAYFAHTL